LDPSPIYASDYRHYESWFPYAVDKIRDWSSITPATRQKLFRDNAKPVLQADLTRGADADLLARRHGWPHGAEPVHTI
jgi:hypothetical protein